MDAPNLKALPRRKLQDLAKKHGIKANLKTDEIIKQLLEKHPNGVPSFNNDNNQPAPSNVQVKDVERRRSMRLSTIAASAKTRLAVEPDRAVAHHDKSSASIVYDEERSTPDTSSPIDERSRRILPPSEDKAIGASQLSTGLANGSALRNGSPGHQDGDRNDGQCRDTLSPSSTQGNCSPRAEYSGDEDKAPSFHLRPQGRPHGDTASPNDSRTSPENSLDAQAVNFLKSIVSSQPAAGPSRHPFAQLTSNRMRGTAEDKRTGQPQVRKPVFSLPDPPRGPESDGPRTKQARSYARECVELLEEQVEIDTEIHDIRRLLDLGQYRSGLAQEKLVHVRAIRKTIERCYLSRLKRDKTLHDGSHEWKRPTAEEEDAQWSLIPPPEEQDSADSDGSGVYETEDEEASTSANTGSGKRKRSAEATGHGAGVQPNAFADGKRMRS